jgi:predicted O-methyltransferase YrrM
MNGVEVGTHCGASAIPIAKCLKQWGGRLTCVDVWLGQDNFNECVQNMRTEGVAHFVKLVVGYSSDVAQMWNEPIDFLYIDADHSYEAVRVDLNAWWPHLIKGGLICGDDYDDPVSPGVKRAWDEFEKDQAQKFYTYETPDTRPAGLKLVYGVKK